MPSTSRALLRATLIALAAVAAQQAVPAERAPVRRDAAVAATTAAEARVIVNFKADSARMRAQAASGDNTPRHAQALSSSLGLALTDGPALGTRMQVLRAKGMSSAALVERLAALPEVESVYEDKRRHAQAVPNDSYYGPNQVSATPAVGQWYLRASSTDTVAAINAPTAWDVTTGSASVVVAVLDTGVLLDHPDLAGKLLPGRDFIGADNLAGTDFTTAADGDGWDADPTDPGDYDRRFAPGSIIPGTDIPNVSSWHGTQVSGLIGATTNNAFGIAGLGWNTKVLPVRVLGVNGGLDSDIIAGMKWAAGFSVAGVPDNPQANWAKVINMSLGSADTCGVYRQVIADLNAVGVMVVVSAGNEGLVTDSPANCPGAVAVGGVRHTGTKVGYSNLGPEIAITAPAGNCVNTLNSQPCLFPLKTLTNLGNGIATVNDFTDSFDATIGTSFSAPLVSGTLALMFAANPALTTAEALAALKSTARPFPVTGADPGVVACRAPTAVAQDECYCTASTCGAGLLDAGGAVLAAVGQQARITQSATSGTVGSPITFNASTSTILNARNVTAYTWTLTDNGASPSSLVASADGLSATLTPSFAGRYHVALTITDTTGARMTAQSAVDVADVPGSGGGSGGGALGAAWLLLLGLGTAALARSRRG